MARLSLFLYVLLSFFVAVSHATPTLSPPPTVTKKAAPPISTICGDIINTNGVVFLAKDAYDCLTSVPFNSDVATKFLRYYNDTIQFQSTLAYLKNPPTTYQQPGVDLVRGLADIQQAVNQGQFSNQYDFEAKLQALIISSHDAHLTLVAGILGVFTFGSPYNIASVSLDGIQLPKVYFSDDLAKSQIDRTWQPSAISTINGINVDNFLSNFAATDVIGSLEPHADFNQLMASPAQDIQSILSTWGGGAMFYPDDILDFVLENGTQVSTQWVAIYNYQDSTGPLQTGLDFYNFFVLGYYPDSFNPDNEAAATSSATGATTASSTAVATGAANTPSSWNNNAYPAVPNIAQPNLGTPGTGVVSGYFLAEASIAVLSLPSFADTGAAAGTFSSTVAQFLSASKAAGMQKVVVDVQQNYGGDVFLAIDTFKQFFPSLEPYAGSRIRATGPVDVMGDAITGYWTSLNGNYTLDDYGLFYDDEFMALTRINAGTGQLFGSWNEFYAPQNANRDSFTTTQRYNLSDSVFSTLAMQDFDNADGFSVHGEGDGPANPAQPYDAEDIIILSDGLCASTCAVFLEMMHHEAGVRTVVAGGLPKSGPMQTPAMSRGATEYGIDLLDNRITIAQILLQQNNDPRQGFLPNRTQALEVRVTYASVNLHDQIRKGEDIPLQFMYEAATCRIFYTPQTVHNYTALWTYAANAIWSDSGLCVEGSTGFATTSANETATASTAQTPSTSTPNPKLGSIIMAMLGSSDVGVEESPIVDCIYPKACAPQVPPHPNSHPPALNCPEGQGCIGASTGYTPYRNQAASPVKGYTPPVGALHPGGAQQPGGAHLTPPIHPGAALDPPEGYVKRLLRRSV